ncbi:MAG: hypothetical protein EBZ48_11650 [Proteobacteria bacterium]|nr:hypothetical protein [Pseudomonadota bacterium]
MGKSIGQLKKAWLIAAILLVLIELFSGWISLLVRVVNPELQPTQIMNYVADNYAFSGLKGLIIIGIASLAMSTADSCINSAAEIGHREVPTARSLKYITKAQAFEVP